MPFLKHNHSTPPKDQIWDLILVIPWSFLIIWIYEVLNDGIICTQLKLMPSKVKWECLSIYIYLHGKFIQAVCTTLSLRTFWLLSIVSTIQKYLKALLVMDTKPQLLKVEKKAEIYVYLKKINSHYSLLWKDIRST
jgi:hypothetical protein